jgi:hypothetical protein
MMKRLVDKFGKLITASFFIMAVGIVTFLLVIPLYHFFGIDTDIVGLLILDLGIVICMIGVIRRYKPHGLWLAAMAILTLILSTPILFLVISLVYYLITGKPLGD